MVHIGVKYGKIDEKENYGAKYKHPLTKIMTVSFIRRMISLKNDQRWSTMIEFDQWWSIINIFMYNDRLWYLPSILWKSTTSSVKLYWPTNDVIITVCQTWASSGKKQLQPDATFVAN